MPFGLLNAPYTFQCLMNQTFFDLLNHFSVVYLDHILVFNESLSDHLAHLHIVL